MANYICNVLDATPEDLANSFTVVFKGTKVSYPDQQTKTCILKNFTELWDGLLDEAKEWNILHVISRKGDGIRMSPHSPSHEESTHTAGSVSLAMARASLGGNQAAQAEEWTKKALGHYNENLVYRSLEETLANEDGTVFQGFRSGDYLTLITDGEPVTLTKISPRWKHLAAMKGVDIKSVKNSTACTVLLNHVQPKLQIYMSLDEPQLEEEVNKLKKPPRFLAKVLKLLLKLSKLEKIEVSHIRNAFLIETIRCYGKEVDFFGILPNIKTILNIEVKAPTCTEGTTVTRKQLKKLLQVGKYQLDDMFSFTCRAFGDMLKGWSYIKILAMPNVGRTTLSNTLTADGVLVLSYDDLADGKWWSGLLKSLPRASSDSKNLNDQYSEVIKRAVGLSRFGQDLRMTVNERSLSVLSAIAGAGNSATLLAGALDTDCMVEKSHLASKGVNTNLGNIPEYQRRVAAAILWSKEQALIMELFPKKLIFENDFGTGKTLVLKSAAKRVAESDLDSKVYYISLAGVDTSERGKNSASKVPAIMDVFCQTQFAEYNNSVGTQIHFKDAQALMEEGLKTVYDGLIALVQRESHASFFIDEWKSEINDISPTVNYVNQLFEVSKSRVWIVMRNQVGGHEGFDSKLSIKIEDKSVLQAVLPVVMRSAGNITKAVNQYSMKTNKNRQTNDAKPLDTVPGFDPKCLLTSFVDLKTAFSKAFKAIGVDPNFITVDKSAVVIVDRSASQSRDLYEVVEEALRDFKVVRYWSSRSSDDFRAYFDLNVYDRILITDHDMFSGMEASNVILVTNHVAIERDPFIRAVSHIVLIVAHDIHDADFSKHAIKMRLVFAEYLIDLKTFGFKEI